jgi:hypothetical protein
MNYRLTFCVFLTLTFTATALSQGKPGGGGGGSTGGHGPSASPSPSRSTTSSQPTMDNDPSLSQRVFLRGKVVLDDGTELTESANVQTICRGRRQTVTHTDSHGNFSFELGDRTASAAAGISEADVDSMGSPNSRGGISRDWRDCELQAQLPGYSSQSIDLNTRLSTLESADIGRLVLHRMGQVDGLTVSATSAMAPKDAQKAYSKGRDKAGKQKWEEAEQLFSKAVEIYPKYAVAWFDLGRIQLHNNDAAAARHSFEQSVEADPKYVNPYRGLAELDTQQQKWPELVTVTNQLLALNPVDFPDAWLRSALGNYYVHNFAAAEKSARQGMKVDDQHQFPRLEYVLGVILVQKPDYPEAALHIQNYLKIATQPAEIADAQKQLAEINRLSASVSVPAAQQKK